MRPVSTMVYAAWLILRLLYDSCLTETLGAVLLLSCEVHGKSGYQKRSLRIISLIEYEQQRGLDLVSQFEVQFLYFSWNWKLSCIYTKTTELLSLVYLTTKVSHLCLLIN